MNIYCCGLSCSVDDVWSDDFSIFIITEEKMDILLPRKISDT
jgi:hypothetical protein